MTQACRVCGCSNFSACEGGCWWIEDDLCSSCVAKDAQLVELAGGPVDGATVEAGVGSNPTGLPDRVLVEGGTGAYHPTGVIGPTGLPLYRWQGLA